MHRGRVALLDRRRGELQGWGRDVLGGHGGVRWSV